jgi:hypothetical protein
VDIIAVVALARSVEEEAPLLAADLGLTVYETAVMLRAPMPVVILRTEERARALDLLGKLRARRHDAVACELSAVASSEDMFRPKSFRFEGTDIVGTGQGVEQRLPLANVFSLVRATHQKRTEQTVTTRERRPSFGRALMTGGLMMTKTTTKESRRVDTEKEPVLYLFRADGAPWLLAATELRYDGLGPEMRVSKAENFEVLLRRLREAAPDAPFDARLVSIRTSLDTVVTSGANHTSTTSASMIDLLAHIVTIAVGRAARPYR